MIFNLDMWMEPVHCLPCKSFRMFVTIGSIYVSIAYFIFSFLTYYKLRGLMRNFIEPHFHQYLSIVFVFCGLAHLFHGLKYQNQYTQLSFLVIIPFLCYYMTKLLISTKNAYQKLMKDGSLFKGK